MDFEHNASEQTQLDSEPLDQSFYNVDAFDQYMNQLDHPLLTKAEEQELAKRVEQGDFEAKQRFIECNLRLVVSRVLKRRNWWRPGLGPQDLTQEGNLGLMHAVDKFDYTQGHKFSTYAIWWIDWAMDRALANKSRAIRIPVNVLDQQRKVARAAERLKPTLGPNPSAEELAAATNLPRHNVEGSLAENLPRVVVSLNKPLDGYDKDTELGFMLESDPGENPEEILLDKDERESFAQQLEELDTETRAMLLELIESSTLLPEGRVLIPLREMSKRKDTSPEELKEIVANAFGEVAGAGDDRRSAE